MYNFKSLYETLTYFPVTGFEDSQLFEQSIRYKKGDTVVFLSHRGCFKTPSGYLKPWHSTKSNSPHYSKWCNLELMNCLFLEFSI